MPKIKKEKSPADIQRERLSLEYIQLTRRLSVIRANFDLVTDEDVIDSLIYEENAVLARLSQLYKEARASGITLDIHEYDNMRNL